MPRFRTEFLFQALRQAFIIILVLAALLSQAQAQPPGTPPVPVVVAPAVEKNVVPSLELVGTTMANRTSQVAAEVGGLVRSILFEERDLVERGAVLVELDKTNLKLGLKAVRAALAGARVRLEEARADLERSASLKKAKTISVQSYEKDLYRVKSLEKSVAQSRAEVARLADSLGRMTVRAPFTGYIVKQHTELGQWLNPGAPVATLIDLSLIKVRLPLPERYLLEIKVGDPARITFDALGPEAFTGRVTAVIPSADEKSRSLPLEISLPNPDGRIKAGLLARATLRGAERKVLLVPKDALVLDRGRATVWVVNSETVKPVKVTPGEAYGRQIMIKGQIKPGQQVVVQGNERLRPGQKVRIVAAPESQDSSSK